MVVFTYEVGSHLSSTSVPRRVSKSFMSKPTALVVKAVNQSEPKLSNVTGSICNPFLGSNGPFLGSKPSDLDWAPFVEKTAKRFRFYPQVYFILCKFPGM